MTWLLVTFVLWLIHHARVPDFPATMECCTCWWNVELYTVVSLLHTNLLAIFPSENSTWVCSSWDLGMTIVHPVGHSLNFHMDVFQLAMTITYPSSDWKLLQLTMDGMVFSVD
jgi:hypothetical protein